MKKIVVLGILVLILSFVFSATACGRGTTETDAIALGGDKPDAAKTILETKDTDVDRDYWIEVGIWDSYLELTPAQEQTFYEIIEKYAVRMTEVVKEAGSQDMKVMSPIMRAKSDEIFASLTEEQQQVFNKVNSNNEIGKAIMQASGVSIPSK